MMPRVIAIYSPTPASGKTTFANLLSQENPTDRPVYILKFADPLRDMLASLLSASGNSPDLARDEGQKNTPLTGPLRGHTVRSLLQSLGTTWGRDAVNKDLWVDVAVERARRIIHMGLGSVIFDDMRFFNEYWTMRAWGASLIRVERPDAEKVVHVSEGALEGPSFTWDCTIVNDGSLSDLREVANRVTREGVSGETIYASGKVPQ